MSGQLKLYGVPLSQPYRAVAWLLLMKGARFEPVAAMPGSKAAKGTRSLEFLAKVPTGAIPAIEEADGFVLHESNAILQYLCDKNGWGDMYPKDVRERAIVDQILHWHHGSLRGCTTQLVRLLFRPDLSSGVELPHAKRVKIVSNALRIVENFYLARGPFLAGSRVTIADLTAYEEIVQLRTMNIFDFTPFPRIAAWLDRMAQLPGHDAAHKSLAVLGDVSNVAAGTPLPMNQMKQATIGGLKALAGAVAKL